MASLLTLVEDVFSEEDSNEAQSDLQRVFSRPSWTPAQDVEQDSSIHTPWPHADGMYFIFSYHQLLLLFYFIQGPLKRLQDYCSAGNECKSVSPPSSALLTAAQYV